MLFISSNTFALLIFSSKFFNQRITWFGKIIINPLMDLCFSETIFHSPRKHFLEKQLPWKMTSIIQTNFEFDLKSYISLIFSIHVIMDTGLYFGSQIEMISCLAFLSFFFSILGFFLKVIYYFDVTWRFGFEKSILVCILHGRFSLLVGFILS